MKAAALALYVLFAFAVSPTRADSLDDNLKLDIEGTLTKHEPNRWLKIGVRIKNESPVNYRLVRVQCTGFHRESAMRQDWDYVERVQRFSTAYGQVTMRLEKNEPPPGDIKCRILDATEGEP